MLPMQTSFHTRTVAASIFFSRQPEGRGGASVASNKDLALCATFGGMRKDGVDVVVADGQGNAA